MTTGIERPELVEQKLTAFEQLQPEFERSFLFIEAIHGQERLEHLTVDDVVQYLHALWVGECKTSLLSIARSVKEYDGLQCLQLLQDWQEHGDLAGVVSFLYRKLNLLPIADITRQIQEAQQAGTSEKQLQRLLHGRQVLLNRGMNFLQMLDALSSLTPDELSRQVQSACQRYGHQPEQIQQQRAAMQSPLYTFVPHQILAERNMLVMNNLIRRIMVLPTDQPSKPVDHVSGRVEPAAPFAESLISPYMDMTSRAYNNIGQVARKEE
ncbi:hypothetical protein KDW_03310 [Dictyobacter vulcani]|uniref:Uncharacterized protein n=1 Tax=Dictyobacter vulcani TaxID=2607529 RepID=A0A5J4KIX4_9CHLR|nr:hypothetical protein [Dictyobacter vulcani]GER86169.1 hypothetical protein KDW_03310 [Dictyobacter vulcani]